MRLVDADTLKAELAGNFNEMWHYTGVRAVIDVAPTIDAEPVRHARLLVTNGWFCCGFCDNILIRKAFCGDALQPPRYCMWCGAKFIDEVSE